MAVRFEVKGSLQEYLDAGNANTKVFLVDEIFSAALNRVYDFYARELFIEGNGLKAPASFLCMNAFMLWLASLRMALTGHASATFPLFRTALESACYAYLVQKDEVKESVWLARNNSEKDMVACRGTFTSAAREVTKAINAVQAGSGDIVLEMYESAIDFGAHPNTKSVLSHIRSEPDTDKEFWRLQLVGIHHHEATEAKRSLLAALEFAWTIALIIFRLIEKPSEDQAKALAEMHDQKDKVLAHWFGENEATAVSSA